jgi:uncharacterized Ntn-hydrolase superfamily protein
VTYSIVARDGESGALGVAVQSDWFSVGSTVPWAEAGVGAVATQSFAEVSYGPLGLDLLRAGRTPEQVLAALTAADDAAQRRQVGVVDAGGRVAVHTGAGCVAEAGHVTGEGFACQANMMERPTVWDAMADCFARSSGTFTNRLLDALDAAEAEGGDIRGRQSAAVLIVAAEPSGRPWADRLVDLRVENHPDPLGELRRLVSRHEAYRQNGKAQSAFMSGDIAGAEAGQRSALELAPDDAQLAFWAGLTFAGLGKFDEARAQIARAVAANPRYARFLRRLPDAGVFPADDGMLAALLGENRSAEHPQAASDC